MHRMLSCLACAALCFSLTGCSAPAASAPSQPLETAPASTPAQTPESTPEPAPEPTPTPVEPYQFGTPLEESGPVADDSFFDSAVFLGDSRTEGLQLFSGLKHGDFYWARGMTVFRADSEDYRVFEVDGKEYNLMEVLALKQYDNVYVMLGVNELGYPAESYESGLMELMDKIAQVQPYAVVYLQIMPPLNDAMCRQNNLAAYINSENLAAFNEAIVRVAAEKRVVLLNTAEAYAGADGQLPAELANDGCHFAYGAYSRWADYLRTHVMDPDRYFGNRAQ